MKTYVVVWQPNEGPAEAFPLYELVTFAGAEGVFRLLRAAEPGEDAIAKAIAEATENPGRTVEVQP